MPHIFLLCLCFSCGPMLLAQSDPAPIETGPRLGVDFVLENEASTNVLSLDGSDSLNISTNKSGVDYSLGMFMQFNIREFLFVRPELLIQMSNRKSGRTDLSGNTTDLTTRLYSLGIPLMLGYHVNGLGVQAGVVLHNPLRSETKDSSALNFDFKDSHTNFSFGIGFRKKALSLDLNYEIPLSKTNDEISIGEDRAFPIQRKPSRLSFRLGYVL